MTQKEIDPTQKEELFFFFPIYPCETAKRYLSKKKRAEAELQEPAAAAGEGALHEGDHDP